MSEEKWEVTMWKNVGTIEEPIMEWVTEKRFYYTEKKITDFDLHDIPNLRKNTKQLPPESK